MINLLLLLSLYTLNQIKRIKCDKRERYNNGVTNYPTQQGKQKKNFCFVWCCAS